ncbi:hypothetical protein GETHLI_30470 [Geothrix limicola]|uniref:Lipoprotein n=1 Tax=Geothrix limicola TaxID=2927978 RepID=A0ABQ5QI68_9BACT|nr:hypothetical protein [Geothrix limicola]GLH74545.1 hypothetical protein GETHLI_30470 [Geothrix limicola]
MRIYSILTPLMLLVFVGSFTGCGGAYTPPPEAPAATAAAAIGLAYTNPSTSGWALVKDASSSPTHLVLNLVGPAGLKARGVGFNLASDGSVQFHKYADGTYLKDTGVFQLKLATPNLYSTKYPNFYEPVILIGGTKNAGKLLTVGIFQKDRAQPAQPLTAPLCQIGIDFGAATAALPSGTTIPLNLVRARIIPEDIGVIPTIPNVDWTDVLNKFRLEDIQISVGTLKAQ